MSADRAAHPPAHRVTINDVARAAGVSRSTTSRALNRSGYVSPPVRQRVLAAARELDYLPDVAARHFKQRRGDSVGLLVSDLREPVQADLAAGVSEALVDSTLTLLVAHTTTDEDQQLGAAEAFVARRVEGMILTPLGNRTVQFLAGRDIAVVEVDGLPVEAECDRVLPDAREAGRLLVRHLTELGHRRLALVLDDEPTASQLLLLDGASDALGPSRAPGSGGAGLVRRTLGEQLAALRAGAGPDRPTAILAGSSGIARRLWEEADGVWPQDLALAAFGDAVWMRLVSPQVTSAAFDAVGLGAMAAERLLARLADPEAPFVSESVPVELRARASTLERARNEADGSLLGA